MRSRRRSKSGAGKCEWTSRVVDAVTAFTQDRPNLVSAGLVLAVAGHWVLSRRYPSLNPFTALQANTMDTISTAVTIYLGTAGAAAIVAGLAGIILVFVIGSPNPRLRSFRDAAGEPLRKTWMTIVAEPLSATLLGIVAAITHTTSGRIAAPWLFELGMALLVHGSCRLLWLLGTTIAIVAADDHHATRTDRAIPLDEIFGR